MLLISFYGQPSFCADGVTPGEPKGVEVPVTSGTRVHLMINELLGAGNPVGTSVTFKVASDVVVDGLVVIAAESEAEGHISEFRTARMTGIVGMEDPYTRITLDWVRCVDGRKIHLNGGYATKKSKVDFKTVITFGSHKNRGQAWSISPGIPVEAIVEPQATVIVPPRKSNDSQNQFAN